MKIKKQLIIQNNKNIFEYQDLVEKLICPNCQNKLSYLNKTNFQCINIRCGKIFPIINNVPILIDENTSIFSIEEIKNSNFPNSPKHIKNFIFRFFPSISNNLSSNKNFEMLDKLISNRINPKILIIGGATITANTDMIINPKNVVIESDVYIGPRTQIILDSHHIPFENETFDLIIYQAVLEHVVDPYKCASEAHRVLKKEGIIFSATPFMQQVHIKQFDFTRFTHSGHRRLFRAFEEIESGIFAGTGVALAWSIKYFVRSLTNIKFLRSVFEMIVSFLFFWLKYIDFLTYKNKGSFDGASGFYFIGRKCDTILNDKELTKYFRENN